MEEISDLTCKRHEGMPFTGKCLKCGAGICSECRRLFGYFCSPECLEASRGDVDQGTKEARRLEEESVGRMLRIVKLSLAVVVVAALAGGSWLVWKYFLDPSGKPAWEYKRPMNSNNFFIISTDENSIRLKTLESIVSISSQDGKETGDAKDSSLNGYTMLVKVLENSFIARNSSSIARFDFQGKKIWDRNFGNKEIFHAMPAGANLLVYAANQAMDYEDPKAKPKGDAVMVLLDSDNRQLWEKEYDGYPGISEIASGDKIAAYLDFRLDGEKYSSFLKAADLADGSEIWKINMEKKYCGGLSVAGDAVIFSDGNSINAVGSDGKSKLWSVKSDTQIYGDSLQASDGYLVIMSYDTIICAGTAEKKILWEKKLENPGAFRLWEGKVLVCQAKGVEKEVQQESSEVKMPKSFDQLDDDLNPFKKKAKEAGPVKRTVMEPYLACYDAATGNELWKSDKVSGDIVAEDGKLVVIRDTARESFLNLSGIVMIYQLDPASGKILFERWGKTRLTAPYSIIGDKLVGVLYDAAGDMVSQIGTGYSGFESYGGIVSIRLK